MSDELTVSPAVAACFNQYRAISLQDSLRDVSPLARQKILATLKDETQQIIYGEWVKSIGVAIRDKDEKPEPCGCLMMDGYLRERPDSMTFVWSDESPMYRGWQVTYNYGDSAEARENGDWIYELIDYYEMQDYAEAYMLIDHVARSYDQWIDAERQATSDSQAFDPEVDVGTKYKGAQVLSPLGRQKIIALIEEIEDGE